MKKVIDTSYWQMLFDAAFGTLLMGHTDYAPPAWSLMYEYYYSFLVYCLALYFVKYGSSNVYKYSMIALLVMIQINRYAISYYLGTYPFDTRLYMPLFALGTLYSYIECNGGFESIRQWTGWKLYARNIFLFYVFFTSTLQFDTSLAERKF